MTLHLNKISETYFDKLFKHEKGLNTSSKARVLLLDQFTTPIISMCYTQSQLLQRDIILIELVEKQKSLNIMKHLDCVVYIKPDKESIQHLIAELNSPHFNSYQVFLNNTIDKTQLEKLAEADEYEVVSNMVEIFQDYLIVNDNLFMTARGDQARQTRNYIDQSNSLTSLLLSLKKCPIIKHESNSVDLKRLGSEILYSINSNSNNNLFDDLNRLSDHPPILLLLERNNDPITPLITPWTYQSMIHEFIGIHKNIVDLKDSNEKVTLTEVLDKFYRESMYLNYGDLTEKFQKYVEEYKKQTKQSSIENLKTQNLNELKKMLTKFPEFKKLSSNILKHLNIISELDKEIVAQDLWEIGELQQSIICSLDSQLVLKNRVMEVLGNIKVSTVNKIKLILLYSIRFPSTNELSLFTSKLNDPAMTNPLPTLSQLSLIKKFRTLFSSNIPPVSHTNNTLGNIFNKKITINDFFNSRSQPKSDNVYMQYVPRLSDILSNLITPQENSTQTPLSTLVPDIVSKQYGSNLQYEPVQDIIIYIRGGVTYEESRLVYELGKSNKKINLIIGGDTIHNSESWLNNLYDLVNESEEVGNTVPDRRTQLRDIL